MASNVVGSLVVNLLAQTGGWKSGLQDATKSLDEFGKHVGKTAAKIGGEGFGKMIGGLFSAKGLGIAGGGLGIGAMFSGLEKIASESLGKVRRAADMNLSLGSFLAYEETARQLGMDIGKVDTAFDKMQKRIAEAADGSREAAMPLEQLGLAAKDLVGLGVDQAFEKIARAIQRVQNPMEKTRAMMEIFGKGGADLERFIDRAGKGQMGGGFQMETENVKALANLSESIGDAWQGFKTGIGNLAGYGVRFLGTMLPSRAIAEEKQPTGGGISEESLKREEAIKKLLSESWELTKALALEEGNVAVQKLRSLGATQSQVEMLKGAQELQKSLTNAMASTKQSEDSVQALELKKARLGDDASPKNFRVREFAKRRDMAGMSDEGVDEKTKKKHYVSLTKEMELQAEIAGMETLASVRERVEVAQETNEETILRHLKRQVGEYSVITDEVKNLLDTERARKDEKEAAAVARASNKEREDRNFRENDRLRTPLEKAQEEMEQLAADIPLGLLSDEQIKRRRMDIRKTALAAMMTATPDANLPSAMSRFSREAYSVIARAGNDPKTELAKQSLRKLDAIEANTRTKEMALAFPN